MKRGLVMSSNLLLMVGACAAALLGLAFLVESEVYIYPRLGTRWWLFTLIAIVAVLFVMRMAFAIWNVTRSRRLHYTGRAAAIGSEGPGDRADRSIVGACGPHPCTLPFSVTGFPEPPTPLVYGGSHSDISQMYCERIHNTCTTSASTPISSWPWRQCPWRKRADERPIAMKLKLSWEWNESATTWPGSSSDTTSASLQRHRPHVRQRRPRPRLSTWS